MIVASSIFYIHIYKRVEKPDEIKDFEFFLRNEKNSLALLGRRSRKNV
jgi:hypothetical protein